MSKITKKTWSDLGVLPLRNGVLFPGGLTTLSVGRERSMELVKALKPDEQLGVLVQRDGGVEDPSALGDFYGVGTLARVHRIVRRSDHYRVILEGLERFKVTELVGVEPYWRVEAEEFVEENVDSERAYALASEVRARVEDALREQRVPSRVLRDLPQEPGVLADAVCAHLQLPPDQEAELLELGDVEERLERVLELLDELRLHADLKQKIDGRVQESFAKNQREAILREQLRAIKKELGEDSGEEEEFGKLRKWLEETELPEDVRKSVERELGRLESMPRAGMEFGMLRNYLELLSSLPWDARATVTDDVDKVAAQLDADHYGLKEAKRRILEHMAVLKMSGNPRGTILCFAGPPGVGKTSLGKSIADATGRPFVRIALGGVRDEAEVRGHRRTYVGALPGRIINGLKKAGVKNPVVLLDEVDKLASGGWSGNPEAALLEVLDPEQNSTFTDHYVEHPFDLSEVLFVCTANNLERLSPPLRDRLEIVEVSGYTTHEKQLIAREHLLPKQLLEHGLDEATLVLSDEVLTTLIRDYTREAGVRQLNRELQKLCRSVTLELLRHKDEKVPRQELTLEQLRKYLGKPRFFDQVAERMGIPGVATGLAWTPVGGDILFIETTQMPGKGGLQITGQLGDVMQESAKAALTFVRSNAETLGITPKFLEGQDMHIHVPAGAVPKDGPSAGVAIFTALTSLLTGRKVRSDTAMTGECTLRGRVLPVGGIKAKVLAAHRAGLTRVILPKRNEVDFEEVPAEIRDSIEAFFVEDMREALNVALETQADTTHHIPSITPTPPTQAAA